MQRVLGISAVVAIGAGIGWSVATFGPQGSGGAEITARNAASPATLPMPQPAVDPGLLEAVHGVSRPVAQAEGSSGNPRKPIKKVELRPRIEPTVTPLQRRILDGLIRRARADNEAAGDAASQDGVTLKNLAVMGTALTYYYTVDKPYDQIDRDLVLARQTRLIRSSVCKSGGVQTLAEKYGVTYDYVFVSQDQRLVTRITAAHELCH